MLLDSISSKSVSPIPAMVLCAVTVAFLLLSLCSGQLVYQLYLVLHKIKNLEADRFLMLQKADELRQSSDDLTRLARQYVVTGDEQHLRDFYQVLAIRNGEAPRPRNYQHIYWDLTEAQREKWHPPGEPEPLREAINQLPFTVSEKQLLHTSEANSNDLVILEERAFNAMQGRVLDASGEYVYAEVNELLARQLLFSNQYREAKARIMLPLDRFMVVVTDRMSHSIQVQYEKEQQIVSLLPLVLLANLLIFLLTIRLTHKKLSMIHGQLKSASLTDAMTGIPNRRYMDVNGRNLVALQTRYNKPLAALMIDIDHFKKVNDCHGHPAGDAVIKQLAKTLKTNVRDSDIVARMGGEEFAILLPESSAEDAAKFADRVCHLIADTDCIYEGKKIQYTVSVGMSILQPAQNLEDLLGHADKALYQAKEYGRNRVCVEDRPNHFVPLPLRA